MLPSIGVEVHVDPLEDSKHTVSGLHLSSKPLSDSKVAKTIFPSIPFWTLTGEPLISAYSGYTHPLKSIKDQFS